MVHTLQAPPSGKVRSNRSKAIPSYTSKDPKGDLRLASDPTTPPDVLSALAAVPEVRWQVAVNPNTPEPVLHKLWSWYHPLAALENPILAYRTLSTGKCFHELVPADVKLSVYDALRKEGRQAEVKSHLPESDRCQWFGYSWNYSGPKDVPQTVLASAQRHLATDVSLEVREQMLERLPKSCLEIFAGDPEKKIRIAVARKLPTFVWDCETVDLTQWSSVVDKLSADPDEDVRQIVAGSKALTPDAHERLAQDTCVLVREALAASGQGKALREQGWRVLMDGGDKMCLLIASNRACHESVRLDLTAHTDLAIRVEAWSHLHFEKVLLTDKLLRRLEALLCDPQQVDERAAVAANRTITAPVIQRLLGCEDQVTRVLAANKRLTEDDRGVLLLHDDVGTAVNAMEGGRSDALVDLGARHPFAAVRALVPGKKGHRASNWRPHLAADPDLKVRESVRVSMKDNLRHYDGKNIRETLAILARDPIAKMRAKVLSDYRMPAEELPRLCQDPSVRVRLAVLRHKGHMVKGHMGLLDHKRDIVRIAAVEILDSNWEGRSRSMLERVAVSDPCAKVRNVLAESLDTSLRTLQKLIKDKASEIQLALVDRPTPSTRISLKKWVARRLSQASEMDKSHPLPMLTGSRNPYLRAVAAGVYRAGKRRLRKLAVDRCWYVRAMTAKNGWHIEPHLLAKLMEDPHPLVREVARQRVDENPQQFPELVKEDAQ